jgi:hypothetical protein
VARLKDPGTPAIAAAPAPNPATLNGEVDWVYEEELDVRSNYFWSPDSNRLAYLQMDETAVPEYPITDWIPTHATVDMQRDPQAGDANSRVRVGVVSAGPDFTRGVMPKARPRPVFRLFDESALDRVAMHIAKLLYTFLFVVYVEIVVTRLPERALSLLNGYR